MEKTCVNNNTREQKGKLKERKCRQRVPSACQLPLCEHQNTTLQYFSSVSKDALSISHLSFPPPPPYHINVNQTLIQF